MVRLALILKCFGQSGRLARIVGRRGELVAIFADGQQQQGNQIKAETERTFVA